MKPYELLSKSHKMWVRKLRHKKYRCEERAFIAEGANALREAIETEIYVIKEIIVKMGIPESLRNILPHHLPIFECPDSDMKSMSTEETPQGVLTICHLRETVFQSLSTHAPDTMLYLDRIADPGNLGTIIRTAAWFNIDKIILSPCCVDPFNPKVIRASAGSIFRTEIFQSIEADTLCQFAEKNNYKLIATAPEGGTPVSQLKGGKKKIVLLGQEAGGLSKDIMKHADGIVSIEGKGRVESLNLAAAAAIILYELSIMSDKIRS